MNIKPILIATVAALTAANANATCTISYSCGSGATGCPARTTNSDPISTIEFTAAAAPTRAGYVFTGWETNRTGTTVYAPGDTISRTLPSGRTCEANTGPGGSITVTAQWVAQPAISTTDIITPTSRAYTDSQMNALQPNFAGLGADKLMTYGTTDGAVGSRDIVTELGTSTTAKTIPTRGAILTGINTKQNTINGTAGWVATNSGTAGVLWEKPIYSTTNNYRQALVTAGDLNQIVTDAVNSELIRVDETGEPNANGTLWKLNTVTNLTLPTLQLANASIDGTSYCNRGLDGTWNDNGTCSTATLSTLGATGNKSGLWGAVMPYGEIVGKSVCSSQSGTYANAATAEQNTALNTEFITQTGNGNLANDQQYCWCKMESINGELAVSRWVFSRSYSSASACADDCAHYCGGGVRAYSDFRQAFFGTVAQ